MKGVLISIPNIKIPEGYICKFPNGEPCILFRWGQDKITNRCLGFGGNQVVEKTFKHKDCLNNYLSQDGSLKPSQD